MIKMCDVIERYLKVIDNDNADLTRILDVHLGKAVEMWVSFVYQNLNIV